MCQLLFLAIVNQIVLIWLPEFFTNPLHRSSWKSSSSKNMTPHQLPRRRIDLCLIRNDLNLFISTYQRSLTTGHRLLANYPPRGSPKPPRKRLQSLLEKRLGLHLVENKLAFLQPKVSPRQRSLLKRSLLLRCMMKKGDH